MINIHSIALPFQFLFLAHFINAIVKSTAINSTYISAPTYCKCLRRHAVLLIAQFEKHFHPHPVLKQFPLCSTLSIFKQHVEKVMQQSVQFHGLLKTPAPNEMKKLFFSEKWCKELLLHGGRAHYR